MSSGNYSDIRREIEMVSRVLSAANNCTSSLLGCSLGRWLCHRRAVYSRTNLVGQASFVQSLSFSGLHFFQVRTTAPVGPEFRSQCGLQSDQEGTALYCPIKAPQKAAHETSFFRPLIASLEGHSRSLKVGPATQENLLSLV